MTRGFSIGARPVGDGAPALVVAEIAQTHDGSLGAAHAYVDAVARAGADAIKFQTHLADAESSPAEPWRVKFSRQDATRQDYWRRMEFTPEQWAGLAAHAREAGLLFLSTPFSLAAVELLERLDLEAWKVGSGELGNHQLLTRLASTGRPVLLSSGMSSFAELDEAVSLVRAAGAPLAIFQCTTAYPCPPEKLGLNVLAELRARYGCPVGLSDHSATIFAGLGAITLGAKLLEVHVAFSRECFGPDVPASVTTAELAQLVQGTRFLEQALAHPVDKDAAAPGFQALRTIFGRSVFAARPLAAGARLVEADLVLKKPGTGLPPAALPKLLGRTLARAVAAGEMLRDEDLVPAGAT